MPAAASLKSLSISSRLSLGFGCMLVLIIAVAALGQLSVSQVNGQMHQITGTGANKAKLVNGMLESVSAIGIQSRSAAMLNDIDPKQARAQIEAVDKTLKEYAAQEAALAALLTPDSATPAEIQLLAEVPTTAKFGGATGNFNAHAVAYPHEDWKAFGDQFVERLGMIRSQFTTQIEHYDMLAALLDAYKRLNTILIDLDRDVWTYVSMNYFKQKLKAGEVGSSAMPHKVNPIDFENSEGNLGIANAQIDFENSEGNLGIANALFEHLSAKLPISRLQRDLTDSTVLRSIGVPFAHSVIALRSMLKGLSKLELNKAAIDADLEDNWAVVAEGIQTILRREGYPKPYEALKALTRTNEKITAATIQTFIQELNVSEAVKAELRAITPFTYTGMKPVVGLQFSVERPGCYQASGAVS